MLGERRLACRKGVLFAGDAPHHDWHALIYDPDPDEEMPVGQALPFAAVDTTGLWIEGRARMTPDAAGVRVLFLQGIGRLVLHQAGRTRSGTGQPKLSTAWMRRASLRGR